MMEVLELVPVLLEDGTTAYAALPLTAAVAGSLVGAETRDPSDASGVPLISSGDEASSSAEAGRCRPLKIDLERGFNDSASEPRKGSRSRTLSNGSASPPGAKGSASPPGGSRVKCAICGHATKTAGGMTLHLRTHSNERPFLCRYDGCAKAFKTSTDFARHKRTHTGERPYPCAFDGCGLSFKTAAQRVVHARRRHTGERPFVCDVDGCGKAFAASSNFKNHARVHSGDRPFACRFEGCHKTYGEYSSLHKHRATHCDDDDDDASQRRRHRCRICVKTYRQTSTLRHHERTVHGAGTETRSREIVGDGAVEEDDEDHVDDDARKSVVDGTEEMAGNRARIGGLTQGPKDVGNRMSGDGVRVEQTPLSRVRVERMPLSKVRVEQTPLSKVSVVRMEQTPLSRLTCFTHEAESGR